MRLPLCVAATAMLAIISAPSAHADTVNFTVSGSGITGSGTLTLVPSTTSSVADAEDITAISGNFTVSTGAANFSGPITSLVLPTSYSDTHPTSDSLVVYDDLFFPSSDAPACDVGPTGGLLDGCGVNFFVTDTATSTQYEVNIYGNGGGVGGYLELDDHGSTYDDENVTVNFTTPAATPEPSTLALLGTGLIGFAGAIKRRIS